MSGISYHKLRREARSACAFRGHDMAKFERLDPASSDRVRAVSTCRNCGMQVRVLTHPAPNEVDISGEAVALNCKR